MNNRIKTTISANTNIFDVNGQWLPKAIIICDSFTRTTAKGELFERSFNANYEFPLVDLVNDVYCTSSIRERANMDINMPTSASPTIPNI